MSRMEQSHRQQIDLQRKYGIATEERRQIVIIGLLADIADSLALFCDMYAKTHDVNLVEETYNASEARTLHNSKER